MRRKITPSEPEPDEVEAYARLETRWRVEGRLSGTATIKRCEAKWQRLVMEIEDVVDSEDVLEDGYDDSREEWGNDLDSRKIIQRAIDQLPPDLSARLADRVRPWDERFIAVTRPVTRPYWDGGWWADRVPAKLGPTLSAALAPFLDAAEQ